VTDSAPDPPLTLKAAEEKFSAFLASQNYPARICWIAFGDFSDQDPNAEECAAQQYAEGLRCKFGIELRAICATDAETFASVFVPKDDVDSQYHLMGHGLKLNCPMNYSTSRVRSQVRWLALRWRHRRGGCRDLFD
jgi:hypothetical protein